MSKKVRGRELGVAETSELGNGVTRQTSSIFTELFDAIRERSPNNALFVLTCNRYLCFSQVFSNNNVAVAYLTCYSFYLLLWFPRGYFIFKKNNFKIFLQQILTIKLHVISITFLYFILPFILTKFPFKLVWKKIS